MSVLGKTLPLNFENHIKPCDVQIHSWHTIDTFNMAYKYAVNTNILCQYIVDEIMKHKKVLMVNSLSTVNVISTNLLQINANILSYERNRKFLRNQLYHIEFSYDKMKAYNRDKKIENILQMV